MRSKAKKLWPRAEWIAGEGRYALVAPCRVTTVTLYQSLDEATLEKERIDIMGCGGVCNPERHRIVKL